MALARKMIVISDFDGTITEKDSLVEILDRYASPDWHKIARLVKSGRMGTRIGLRKECALCRVTRKEYLIFLKRHIRIDRTFKKFLPFCEKNKIRFIVVSGGFTLNIRAIFEKYALKNVPYYANSVAFKGNVVKARFPSPDKHCAGCSHCKAPYVRRYKKLGYYTVFVGDSVTDQCPAKVADLVFAKHHLIDYCKENHIPYVPYGSFADIQAYLKSRLSKIITAT
ncbi:MAG: MtnX-like HAD-IB family phosphatase [Candidatus Omnitrophota bacterium]